MRDLFLTTLNMSLTASVLVLAVLLLRLLLRRAPTWTRVLLWGLVAVRLVFPFSIESPTSVLPDRQPLSTLTEAATPAIPSQGSTAVAPSQPSTDGDFLTEATDVVGSPHIAPATDPVARVLTVGPWVWLAGILAMIGYAAISYLRLRYQVKESIPGQEKARQCDAIATPFILGIIKPTIYLPATIDEGDIAYVLAHEQAHLKRGDHLWKPLGFLLLTIHWFNPLLWLAYILLCRDIELACDERVLKELGEDNKKPYATALVNCSIPRRQLAACPLAFGEGSVKQRVGHVLNYKKPAFWVILAAVVACVITAACLLTDPVNPGQNQLKSDPVLATYEEISATVFGTDIYRRQITEITLLDSLSSAPDNAVDVSANEDGSVKLWFREDYESEVAHYTSSTETLYHMYLAADGNITAPSDCNFLFAYYYNITAIRDLSLLDTRYTRNMMSMFDSCHSLYDLNVSHLSTRRVTTMRSMFAGCWSLSVSDYVWGFDTRNVVDMKNMFMECRVAGRFDLTGWDTGKVTDMSGMFSYCDELRGVDMTGLDTRQVTDMAYMFVRCQKLSELRLNGLDTGAVKSMAYMFSECSSLTELDISHFDMRQVEDAAWMLSFCPYANLFRLPDLGELDIQELYGANFRPSGTYKGQIISMEYIKTDIVYPWDVRNIRFHNGYAVYYDYGTTDNHYDGSTGGGYLPGWNVMDSDGNRLFEQSFQELTNFNSDGLAMAYPHVGDECWVINAHGEVLSSHLAADYPYGGGVYPISGIPTDSDTEGIPMEGIAGGTSDPYKGLVAFVKDGRLGIADENGNIIISPTFAVDFSAMTEHLSLHEDIVVVEAFDHVDYSPLVLVKIRRALPAYEADSLTSLTSIRSQLAAQDKDAAILFLGDFDSYETCIDDLQTSYHSRIHTYLRDITATQFVEAPGKQVYAIVPRDADTAVTVYERTEASGTTQKGRLLYDGTPGLPVLVRCNQSDRLPNVDIHLLRNGEETAVFSPSRNIPDGHLELVGTHTERVEDWTVTFTPSDTYTHGQGLDTATVTLLPGNRFQMVVSPLGSYLPIGSYTEIDDVLVLSTDDGAYHYTFRRQTDGLVFDAAHSSPLPEHVFSSSPIRSSISDGAVFTKNEAD